MLKKFSSLSTVLILLFATVFSDFVSAATHAEKDAKKANEIKQKVEKLKNNKGTHVTVQLKDGKSVKGFLSNVGEESFVVTDSKTHVSTTMAYGDVDYIVKNLSPKTKWIIAGAVIGTVVVMIVCTAVYAPRD